MTVWPLSQGEITDITEAFLCGAKRGRSGTDTVALSYCTEQSVTLTLPCTPSSGSYLTLTHATAEIDGDGMLDGIRRYNESGATPPLTVRSLQEIARFFDRLELLTPGVVSCSLWRPDPGQLGVPVEVDLFGGVGRKP